MSVYSYVKVKLALNIDAELKMIVKQHCCLHNINMSDYMSELIAEHFNLRLNPDYSLNMDSAKELRMKQVKQITILICLILSVQV